MPRSDKPEWTAKRRMANAGLGSDQQSAQSLAANERESKAAEYGQATTKALHQLPVASSTQAKTLLVGRGTVNPRP